MEIVSEPVIVDSNGPTPKLAIFIVEEVDYREVGKMEGLLRCSTMPIIRD